MHGRRTPFVPLRVHVVRLGAVPRRGGVGRRRGEEGRGGGYRGGVRLDAVENEAAENKAGVSSDDDEDTYDEDIDASSSYAEDGDDTDLDD